MRILVTGASGFLGGRLAQYLAAQGHEVLLGSRRVRPDPDLGFKGQCVVMDWDDQPGLRALCADVDLIVHAAGMNAQDCARDPEAALAFNGEATARLTQAAVWAGVSRFVYLSTAHVYAAPLVGQITEDHPALNPHPYATTHLAGEQSVQAICQGTSTQALSLRLSNAFGAPVYPEANCWVLLVNDLCRQSIETGGLRLGSSGIQHRDFLPISTLCQKLGHLLDRPDWQALGPCINFGSGLSVSVREMAEQVQTCAEAFLGAPCPLEYPADRSGAASEPLVFTSARLTAPVKIAPDQLRAELMDLLEFCQRHFEKIL